MTDTTGDTIIYSSIHHTSAVAQRCCVQPCRRCLMRRCDPLSGSVCLFARFVSILSMHLQELLEVSSIFNTPYQLEFTFSWSKQLVVIGTEREVVATWTLYLKPCASNATLSVVIVDGHSALESVRIYTSLRRRDPNSLDRC